MYSLMMTANGHVDPRGSMAPPIIMRTAATPMPTPKSSLGPESVLGDDLMYREGVPQYADAGLGFSDSGSVHADSRRGSATSMDPIAYDQHSPVSGVMLRASQHGFRALSWQSSGADTCIGPTSCTQTQRSLMEDH